MYIILQQNEEITKSFQSHALFEYVRKWFIKNVNDIVVLAFKMKASVNLFLFKNISTGFPRYYMR